MTRSQLCTVFTIGYTASLLGLFTIGTSPSTLAISIKPPITDNPGGRAPGGSRDPDCLSQNSITALIPTSQVESLTTTVSPTFFVYVPETTAKTGEFVLQNEYKKTIYKTSIHLSGKPGIVSFSPLTKAASPKLEVGKRYRWFFSIICDAEAPDKSGNPFVQGWVKRTAPNLAVVGALSRASLRDRVAIYQNAGFWYEALATLAELRRSRPNDPTIAAEWANLLRSAGLAQIAAVPLQ